MSHSRDWNHARGGRGAAVFTSTSCYISHRTAQTYRGRGRANVIQSVHAKFGGKAKRMDVIHDKKPRETVGRNTVARFRMQFQAAAYAALEILSGKEIDRVHGEFESECPGCCGAQDTFYVGSLKGVAVSTSKLSSIPTRRLRSPSSTIARHPCRRRTCSTIALSRSSTASAFRCYAC